MCKDNIFFLRFSVFTFFNIVMTAFRFLEMKKAMGNPSLLFCRKNTFFACPSSDFSLRMFAFLVVLASGRDGRKSVLDHVESLF